MNAVEHIGSGINRIHRACKDYGIKAPIVHVEENWVSLIFLRPATKKDLTAQVTAQATEQVILDYCNIPRSSKEIMKYLNLKHREHFRSEILKPLIESKKLLMTIPEKPNSPKQKYYSSNKEDAV